MTFIADKTEKCCFAACPQKVINAGQCTCHNRVIEQSKPKSEKS